jgi:hypothetical protein
MSSNDENEVHPEQKNEGRLGQPLRQISRIAAVLAELIKTDRTL